MLAISLIAVHKNLSISLFTYHNNDIILNTHFTDYLNYNQFLICVACKLIFHNDRLCSYTFIDLLFTIQ